MKIGRLIPKVLLSGAGVVLAVLAAEGILWLADSRATFGCARELNHFSTHLDAGELFTTDPALGFRPVLGTDLYSPWGTLVNAYTLRKPAGKTRLLFIGDSVTARGRIVKALHTRAGDAGYEYWNAGVESYNTKQEVEYYRLYNAAIQPDQVILTFHMNDFETTPVAFRQRDGRLVVYAPNVPLRELNATLFRLSRLYRLVRGLRRDVDHDVDAIVRETDESLALLKQTLDEQGVRLTVLVLPFLRPYADWSPGDRLTRQMALEMMARLQLRHFDLLPVVEQAIAAGVSVSEEQGDDWHPGDALSELIAAHLVQQGLLTAQP